jgi:hypothetical protein
VVAPGRHEEGRVVLQDAVEVDRAPFADHVDAHGLARRLLEQLLDGRLAGEGLGVEPQRQGGAADRVVRLSVRADRLDQRGGRRREAVRRLEELGRRRVVAREERGQPRSWLCSGDDRARTAAWARDRRRPHEQRRAGPKPRPTGRTGDVGSAQVDYRAGRASRNDHGLGTR